jgi:hypothetical protein
VDKLIGGVTGLVRALSVEPAVPRTSEAVADFLVRRGFPAPSDMAVRYVAVETDADRGVVCVVGVFSSARDARAYADAVGWADFDVAPYRLHPSWLSPGQL